MKLASKLWMLTALRPTLLPLRHPAFRLPRPGRLQAGDLVLAAGAASLVLSVLFLVTEPARERLRERSCEVRTVANAATLQLAAETYAAANLGQYPRDARALVPWLPEGRPPRNPYTGETGHFRAAPGEVTWRRLPGRGYQIEAWGAGPDGARVLATLKGQLASAKL